MAQVKTVITSSYNENVKALVKQANELLNTSSELNKAEARGMLRVINVLELVMSEPECPTPISEPAPQKLTQGNPMGLDGIYGVKLNTVGDLRDAMSELCDEDQITLVTIDLDSGDEQDHYPMHLDVIDGIRLTDGSIINEVQFVQERNCEPDTRDKQRLVDVSIENIMTDYFHGDTTVIDELLSRLPWEILKHSLPEDQWEEFNTEK